MWAAGAVGLGKEKGHTPSRITVEHMTGSCARYIIEPSNPNLLFQTVFEIREGFGRVVIFEHMHGRGLGKWTSGLDILCANL